MNKIFKALLKTIAIIILGVGFVFLMNTFTNIMMVLLVILLIIILFISFYAEED